MSVYTKKIKVRSSSDRRKFYTVSFHGHKPVACSCFGWIFHGHKDCRHIRALKTVN